MLNDLDLTTIPVEGTRRAIRELLNLVETLALENRGLRDELNRLKGEQGQPTIRSQIKLEPADASDHSSKRERRVPKPRTRGPEAR
jgi:hypothetical protein